MMSEETMYLMLVFAFGVGIELILVKHCNDAYFFAGVAFMIAQLYFFMRLIERGQTETPKGLIKKRKKVVRR